jgi:hypothetical protein
MFFTDTSDEYWKGNAIMFLSVKNMMTFPFQYSSDVSVKNMMTFPFQYSSDVSVKNMMIY